MAFKSAIKAYLFSIRSPPRVKVATGIIIVFEWRKHFCNHFHVFPINIVITDNLNLLHSSLVRIGVKNNQSII